MSVGNLGDHLHIDTPNGRTMCAVVTEVNDDGSLTMQQEHPDNTDCPVAIGWKAMQAVLASQWMAGV